MVSVVPDFVVVVPIVRRLAAGSGAISAHFLGNKAAGLYRGRWGSQTLSRDKSIDRTDQTPVKRMDAGEVNHPNPALDRPYPPVIQIV
jgi:hypothetical protein